MSTNLHDKNIIPSSAKAPQGMGFYCDELILQKIDLVAGALHWSRNMVIIEAIQHVLNLIERYRSNITPDFVIITRALQQAGRCNFHFKEELSNSEKPKKINTSFTIHPALFKKIEHIADSIGYSRNSFITECIIHALNIIKDEQADPFPNIVKMGRVIVPSITAYKKDSDIPEVFTGMSIKQIQPNQRKKKT